MTSLVHQATENRSVAEFTEQAYLNYAMYVIMKALLQLVRCSALKRSRSLMKQYAWFALYCVGLSFISMNHAENALLAAKVRGG